MKTRRRPGWQRARRQCTGTLPIHLHRASAPGWNRCTGWPNSVLGATAATTSHPPAAPPRLIWATRMSLAGRRRWSAGRQEGRRRTDGWGRPRPVKVSGVSGSGVSGWGGGRVRQGVRSNVSGQRPGQTTMQMARLQPHPCEPRLFRVFRLCLAAHGEDCLVGSTHRCKNAPHRIMVEPARESMQLTDGGALPVPIKIRPSSSRSAIYVHLSFCISSLERFCAFHLLSSVPVPPSPVSGTPGEG